MCGVDPQGTGGIGREKAGSSPSGCMHRSTRRTIEQTDRAELPSYFLGVAVSPPVGSHVWRMRCR